MHVNACFSWRIGVYNIAIILISCAIIRHCFLCYAVLNLMTIFVFWKIIKTPPPITISICLYFLTFNNLSFRHKIDGNACRSAASIVIIIPPNLASANRNSFRSMAVFNYKAVLCVFGDFRRVSVYLDFFDSINNLLTCFELWKVFKTAFPTVSAV